MIRTGLCTLAAAAVLVLPGAAAAITPVTPTYRGYVGTLNPAFGRVGPDSTRGQGGYHGLVFREIHGLRTTYRVCLRHRAGHATRCWTRIAPAGRSEINVSIFVNDVGGPGRWHATWSVGGRVVARYGFYLSPEGA